MGRDDWYKERAETKRLFEKAGKVKGSFPKERLLAAKPGWSGPFRREWIGKFPIKLANRDAGIKRDVRLSITTWQGISLGGVHYYGEAREDDDAMFLPKEHDEPYPAGSAPKEDRWIECQLPDDSNAGREFKLSVLDRRDAEMYIRALQMLVFPESKYEYKVGLSSRDELFEETDTSRFIVLPVTEMEFLWSMRAKKRKLRSPVEKGDYVRAAETKKFQAPLAAVKCPQAKAIGRVVEVKLSKPDKAASDDGYWEQYYAVIDTKVE